MREPNINEVKNIVVKHLEEMKINDADIVSKIMKIIEAGTFLHDEGRELKETVESLEIEYVEKTGKVNEKCKVFKAPYVRVGDVEIVQLVVPSLSNVQEIDWGVPERNDFSVKCIEEEWEIEYETFTLRKRGCIVDIMIVPKTPIVYVEYDEDDECWLSNTIFYVYVHPYGWWNCVGLCQ